MRESCVMCAMAHSKAKRIARSRIPIGVEL
jgi:hypothetical protein